MDDLLDMETVEMLKEMDDEDEPGFFAELVQTYISSATETLGKLEAAMQASDAVMLREYAHSIKGSSANIGACKMAGVAKIIENQSRTGNLEGLAERVVELRQLFPLSCSALEQV